jgi:polar amino acid transport system substrate-binding protein
MHTNHWLVAAVLALLLTGYASAYTVPKPEATAALAPTGKLRVGLYTGNPLSVIQDRVSQEMRGVAFDLGREMARRMGVPFEPIVHPSVGALLGSTKSGQWDIAFFLISPDRMRDVDFTGPVIELELGYLVPNGSPLSTSADVDRPGTRVAVSEKGQADVILSGLLKHAILIRAPGLSAVLEHVKSDKADAVAANKAILHELSRQLPDSKILDGRFAVERLAMAIPKGRDAGLAYARRFIEEAKSEGLVKAAVERAGVRGAVVAPPE